MRDHAPIPHWNEAVAYATAVHRDDLCQSTRFGARGELRQAPDRGPSSGSGIRQSGN